MIGSIASLKAVSYTHLYGVSIRPDEILNDSLQAQNDPQQRKDFFAKSLNVYTNALAAYFDIYEFRKSDRRYNWTLEDLLKMPIVWYGGADLSRLYDLTAAALYGLSLIHIWNTALNWSAAVLIFGIGLIQIAFYIVKETNK